MSKSINAVILGAGGYVGGELLRLINDHPSFTLAAAVSDSQTGRPIATTFPHLSQALNGVNFVARDGWLNNIDDGTDLALFSAAPHGASAAVIAETLAAATSKNLNVHVVDSSADFRYQEQTLWESIYGEKHGAPELLSQFTCAVPEHVDSISTPGASAFRRSASCT